MMKPRQNELSIRENHAFHGQALVQEAISNLRSFPVRTAIVVAVSLLAGMLALTATLMNVRDVVAIADAQQIRGLDTLSVTADGGLPAELCHASMAISGVTYSGGVVGRSQVRVASAPGEQIMLWFVTQGYLGAIFPNEDSLKTGSVVTSRDLSKELGLAPGARLSLAEVDGVAQRPSRPLLVDVAATTEARFSGLNRSVFVTALPEGTVSECVVVARPGTAGDVAKALDGWFAVESLRVQPLLSESDLDVDPEMMLSVRWSQWVWLGAGLVLVMMNAALSWTRRDEWALYRLLGASRRSVATMVCLESSLVVVIPGQLGAALAIAGLGGHEDGTVLLFAFFDATKWLALLVVAAGVACALAVSGDVLEGLKGK